MNNNSKDHSAPKTQQPAGAVIASATGDENVKKSDAADERFPMETAAPERKLEKPTDETARRGVPSLYDGPDPEFNRPIFRKHVDTPPAAPSGTIIRKASTPVRPPLEKPRFPRKSDVANVAPLSQKQIETGIHALDIRTGGLSAGTMTSLSGIDRTARTHLEVCIARHVAEQGGRVLALISPTEEGFWPSQPNLMVDVAVQRKPETLIDIIDEMGRLDLVILDPIHSMETPSSQERVAAMDHATGNLLAAVRRRRVALLASAHMVDRAERHEGVSLHPWMFRDVSCLLEFSSMMLMVRAHRSAKREILVYRRGLNNRIGGLPSFVLPWV
ncbi:MAG: hypothetical protein M5R36_23480 [Deltaproteobacteria bacterium]|nr:hypothetical protein [Deltaproteobacteria bacterium]